MHIKTVIDASQYCVSSRCLSATKAVERIGTHTSFIIIDNKDRLSASGLGTGKSAMSDQSESVVINLHSLGSRIARLGACAGLWQYALAAIYFGLGAVVVKKTRDVVVFERRLYARNVR